MKTYTLVSKPIDHFPVVLYDKDFHCIDDSYHITNKTYVIEGCLSDWSELPGTKPYLESDAYEGFMVLKSSFPINIRPITVILVVTDDEECYSMRTVGIKW